MTYDLETLNIFIYAFFALAAASAMFAVVAVPMVLRRPVAARRPALQLVSGAVREHPAMASRGPLPHERAA
jgi:hypothetical protein